MTALTPAERILKSLGIETPGEIDLEAIAWTRGAVVDYRPLDRCEATIVGSKRKAVIAVNLYGNMPDMGKLEALCARRGIRLIEDAAESIGSVWGGRPAGRPTD